MDLSNYNFFPFLIERDTGWCKLMNYFNPYDDPFEYTLSEKIPIFDKKVEDFHQTMFDAQYRVQREYN